MASQVVHSAAVVSLVRGIAVVNSARNNGDCRERVEAQPSTFLDSITELTWRNTPPEYGSIPCLNKYSPSCTTIVKSQRKVNVAMKLAAHTVDTQSRATSGCGHVSGSPVLVQAKAGIAR